MSSSIVRKVWMSLTGLFLISFLVIHLSINLLTLSSNHELFNQASHFMGTNPVIQTMQWVLALGFILHIGTGIRLQLQNSASRPIKYAKSNPSSNSTMSSRSMIITGILVLLFLILHIRDYWWVMHFGVKDYADDYELVVRLFDSLPYTALYIASFVLLGFHLNHGFQSAFQSVGANHQKYTPWIKKIGTLYSIATAAGFTLIAIYHFMMS